MIKNCQWCDEEFESTAWNNRYCCREHVLEYRTKYRAKGYSIKYAAKNPRTFISRLLLKRRYNKHQLSLDYLEDLYNRQEGLCALSGIQMTNIHGQGYVATNISIDQIIPGAGYIPGNVQLVCRVINSMKYTTSVEDFIEWCKIVVDYNIGSHPTGRLKNVKTKVVSRHANRIRQPKHKGY